MTMDFDKFPAVTIDYAILIPAAILCYLPMKNQLRYGVSKTLRFASPVLLVFLLLLSWLTCYFDTSPNTFYFVFFVLFFICYHKSLTVPVAKSLTTFVYVCALMSLFANYAIMFDAWLHPDSGADTFSLESGLFQLGLGLVVAAISYFPVTRFGTVLIDSLNLPIVWYITLILSGIFLAINVIIRPLHYETLYTNNVFRVYIIVVSMMLVTLVLLTLSFYFIVSGMVRERETGERNRMLEMQETQYIKQQEYIKLSSAARHDFRQSIRILEGLAESGDLSAVQDYLKKYNEQMPQKESVDYCSNIAVNALLNYYHEAAKNSRIKERWDIRMPKDISISDVDLCNIIGNLLENAIAACREVEEGKRYIALSVTMAGDDASLLIVMTNPYTGTLRKRKDRYLSTRRNGSGIGLSSIRSIAERYDGIAEFSDENGVFKSNVMVMM